MECDMFVSFGDGIGQSLSSMFVTCARVGSAGAGLVGRVKAGNCTTLVRWVIV